MIQLLVFLILFSAGVSAATPDENSGKEHASWWVQNYGVVTAAGDPLVLRADRVFARVLAAADKRGNRPPRLLVLAGNGQALALAIQDGSILLNQRGLRLCYERVDPETGDARVAFVLGHELAHLANDDFWHLFAFVALKKHASDSPPRDLLLELIRTRSDADPNHPASHEAAQLKELQADSYALLYMTIAGYSPQSILDEKNHNFFHEWISQSPGGAILQDVSHPDPESRFEFLQAHLRAAREDLEFFRFGVRLHDLGRYEDSILLMERFLERFPSREVYNNLGLSHYQLALRFLASCSPERVTRFQLATLLDPETLVRSTGPADTARAVEGCLARPEFLNRIHPALQCFKKAGEMDSSYVPSRLNLSSLHIVMGAYSLALAALDEIKNLAPDHPGMLNNRAVALYGFGISSGVDTMDRSVAILEDLLKAHPENAEAWFNIASFHTERGRAAAARNAYEKYLETAPSDLYSGLVRRKLHDPVSDAKAKPPDPEEIRAIQSPIPLGEATQSVLDVLQRMNRKSFRIGSFRGDLFYAEGKRVLMIDGVVEMVESALEPPEDYALFRSQSGNPKRVVAGPLVSTMVYDNFAIDLVDGAIRTIVYFEE